MTEVFAKIPNGAHVVGLVNHNGQVIVATSDGVYRLVNGALEPIPFRQPRQPFLRLQGFWQRVWNR